MPLKSIALSDLQKPETDARTAIDNAKFDELVASIRRHGLIEPVVVRQKGEGLYEVIAGARRVLAAHAAGLGKIPCMVTNMSDEQVDAVRLDENLIREDLNQVDIARYLERVMAKYKLTYEEVASRLGRTKAYVSQLMTLLHKDPVLLDMVEKEEIVYTVARELNRLPNENSRRRLARFAARSGANSKTVHEWVERELVDMNRASGTFVEPPPVTYVEPGSPTMIVHPCRACGRVGDINAMQIFRFCPDCGQLLEQVIYEGVFKDEQRVKRGSLSPAGGASRVDKTAVDGDS